ncbi:MAG: cell division protein FtsL [Deltaproteobacteria bacterium]|jgi:cell division protein FtsL|nr:cell division protein FtsL [Deltaproteobacteria bacterium]
MSIFKSSAKNGYLLDSQIGLVQPKWKKTTQAGVKQRSQNKVQLHLEQSRKPENQLLARLPNETLNFLSGRNFFLIASAALIFFLGLLVFIRISHSQNELGMEISRLTKYQVLLQEENRRLKIELARQASLDELEALARRELGLISPSQGQIVVID